MLGYLWIFNHLQTSTLYQISNSLKTENSLTVLPRLLSVFRMEFWKDPVPKKPSLPKWLAKKVSMYQCFEAGHNIVSHRLSLLFPKLRLSNFMISSLASAIFVQCPPKKMCTIEPPRPCRATAAIQAVGLIMPCLPLLAGWPVTRPAC